MEAFSLRNDTGMENLEPRATPIEESHLTNWRKKATVLVPCRNEAAYIEKCVRNLFNFSSPEGGFEVIVIDGMSTDGTRDVLTRLNEEFPDLIVIDNPNQTVPHAMNLGIERARGAYIVRADVRCIHPKSYLRDLIELSEKSGSDNVGGVLVPVEGKTYKEKSIALAYKSPIAMGGALRDRGHFCGETDTVYGGCFKRERLLEIGKYDVEMVRNQDDELSFRLRKMGGKITQDGQIKIQYYPRKYYGQLFKQFMQYGYWKVVVIRKHPQQASLRHFLPVALILGFLVFMTLAATVPYGLLGLAIYGGGYFLAVGSVSLKSFRRGDLKLLPGTVYAIFLIHIGFGTGFLMGVIGRFSQVKLRWFESLSR
ncbi:MAG TPA: glycosyltransferase family 2 protein [Thermodesulfobacteriota bacterium]|nr:glycosyltransferase family 2 protein [Thermodesulfobacteriota bacterium]